MRALILMALLLLLNGCGSRNALGYFKKDQYFEDAMTQLQTGTIVQALQTRAVINAVYLNGVDSKTYHGDEYFFIAVYIDNDFFDDAKRGLFNENYSLTLNGAKALKITPLDDDNALRRSMPLAARWNEYYLVRFEESESSKMGLKLASKRYGEIILNYSQVTNNH